MFLTALLPTGSCHLASSVNSQLSNAAIEENKRVFLATYAKGRYAAGHEIFLQMARAAEGNSHTAEAIADWNNTGACSLAIRQYRAALNELLHSRDIAERSQDWRDEARSSNNIASLYIQMGDFQAALRVASDAASRKPAPALDTLARLDAQRAEALSNLHRLDEARPLFAFAISTLDSLEAWDADVRARGIFGIQLIQGGDTRAAEPVLTEALRLARIHRIGAANVLRALALLKAAQRNPADAARLFDAALSEPPGAISPWLIYADRGEFLLDRGDPSAALRDFLAARRLAAKMRADIVPADEDRVALESGLGRIAAGIVDSDNQLAHSNTGRDRARQAFDVAEQDRQWSLRALVPTRDDWRTRLPREYWDLLAQYQTLERALGNAKTGPAVERAGALAVQLQMIEAKTGGDSDTGRVLSSAAPARSALAAVQNAISPEAVLLSFYTGERRSWLWAVTKNRFDIYALPPAASLRASVDRFVASLRSRNPDVTSRGRELYSSLFGRVPDGYLSRPRWFLELDGPLYNLPFPALVTSAAGHKTEWLIERASIQIVPGALMMESSPVRTSGSFIGIADPVYNAADARYSGRRKRVESSLSRLPNTEAEVKNCASAWGCPRTEVLTGMNAGTASLENALRSRPSIIHFATHVISGESDHGSGIIALSLDRQGSLGLLGPREILARPVTADLVVLDGCHSAQGAALPGAGLMGLTRAWIGAGAHAVLATLWDVPDDAQSALPAFYSSLRAHPDLGPAAALRDAQLRMLADNKGDGPETWAGYFLLARR